MPHMPHIAAINPHDTLEALLASHGTGTARLQFTVLTLTIMGLVAAATTRTDITVRATGTLVPVVERQTLRTLSDGLVDRVLSHTGQHVTAGDTLVVLATDAANHIRLATQSTLDQQRARRSDLRALLHLTPGDSSSTTLHLEQSRTSLGQAEVEWRQSSIDVLRTERTRDRLKELGRRGFAVPSELESAEFDVARAREVRMLAFERRRAVWADDAADAEQQVTNLQRDLATRASDQTTRHVVAPVNGTVEDIMALSAGSVVRAGDAIATISPDGALVADVLVPPRDVTFLHTGMPARLVIEGYNVQEWGAVNATVTAVASDYTVSDGHAVFRVRVQPVRAELHRPNGTTVRLGKGLRCQVHFTLGNTRLMDLARRRAGEWFDPSGGDARTTSQ
ncbi:MAG: HlyD family efflux transporter periplasmic adaptor subunit [bacterium]